MAILDGLVKTTVGAGGEATRTAAARRSVLPFARRATTSIA
jgi:hypothetical protein